MPFFSRSLISVLRCSINIVPFPSLNFLKSSPHVVKTVATLGCLGYLPSDNAFDIFYFHPSTEKFKSVFFKEHINFDIYNYLPTIFFYLEEG